VKDSPPQKKEGKKKGEKRKRMKSDAVYSVKRQYRELF
jgi:hypothetical protein